MLRGYLLEKCTIRIWKLSRIPNRALRESDLREFLEYLSPATRRGIFESELAFIIYYGTRRGALVEVGRSPVNLPLGRVDYVQLLRKSDCNDLAPDDNVIPSDIYLQPHPTLLEVEDRTIHQIHADYKKKLREDLAVIYTQVYDRVKAGDEPKLYTARMHLIDKKCGGTRTVNLDTIIEAVSHTAAIPIATERALKHASLQNNLLTGVEVRLREDIK